MMIGSTISHYKIVEKLGEGGMGVVYKAQDTKLNRLVALKFLPQRVGAGSEEKARFLQEAQAAAALNHPNICTIYGIEEADGQQFIEMEYIDGKTLRQKFEEDQLKVADVLSYAMQIAEALQEAHSKGIVHRDIKADNVMLNSKNQVKVMDFGLAKLKGTLKLTRVSSTVGTLGYMAPEQVQGGEVDARSDIFSLGVLLFEMLTGRLPFRGEHEAAMIYSILNEEPEPVSKHREDVPQELAHIIRRALEKDPSDRYDSVAEILGELRHLKKQSSRVTRTGAISPRALADAVESSAVSHSGAGEKVSRPSGSRKMLIAAASVVGLVIIGLVAWMMLRPGEPTTPTADMKIVRLTATGKASNVVMSPEGRLIVYSQREKGKQSLWVRQIATASTVQILPAADVAFVGLTLSKDGNYLYYVASEIGSANTSLYKMPSLGGSSKKLMNDVRSPISLSPDEKQLAFTRYYPKSGEFALMVANEDGSGERILATHKSDKWFDGKPAWSPNGETILCPLGNWEGGLHYAPVVVHVKDGSEQEITGQQWQAIASVEWLHDGSGFIVLGNEKGSSVAQVWLVQKKDGAVRRISNDLNDYGTISLAQNSQTLCTIQSEVRSNLWVLPGADASKAVQITSGKEEGLLGITFAPDSRVIYSNQTVGNNDIWICNADGTGQRQLTSEPSNDYQPAVSPDGSTVFFASDRSGIPNIWRMQSDGSKPQQLTFGGEDYRPEVSADGKWVYFDSWDAGPLLLMKVSVDGGEPQAVFNKGASQRARSSPDGKLLAFVFSDDQQLGKPQILIMPSSGGDVIKSFEVPTTANSASMQWTPNSRAISYIDTREGVSNIWEQPLGGAAPRKLTEFKSDLIFSFCWSRDGKNLAIARGQTTSDVVLISNFR